MSFLKRKIHLSSFKIILFSFASAIFTGAVLLWIPLASRGAEKTSFLDALFTATSSVCVTGLVVKDTWAGWSIFGKSVILLLIQTGGMGVVTVAVLIGILSGMKISLRQKTIMKDSVSEDNIGGIIKLTSFILKFTLLAEFIGALFLFPTFSHEYGFWSGIGFSVFHAVSAFCNAGFDLSGKKQLYSSLIEYSSNISVNLTIMLLIIAGGLGFHTWADIINKKNHFKKYSLQTKIVLFFSFILIILPAVYFFFAEFQFLPFKDRILKSLFQSVTPRTAGFNTVDLNNLSQTGKMLTITLMLIGGSPGSTAGGMKTTTFFVLAVSALSVFSSKKHCSVFRRRIALETVRKAAALFLIYIMLFLFSAMTISKLEALPLLSCMFETASAIGTVGLSLGITGDLSAVSKLILIFLMFFGRVGGLTFVFAAIPYKSEIGIYPEEEVTIG